MVNIYSKQNTSDINIDLFCGTKIAYMVKVNSKKNTPGVNIGFFNFYNGIKQILCSKKAKYF